MNDAQRGQVLSFGTGSNPTNYVDAGTVPAIGITSIFTWSFWAYSQQTANNNVILGNRYDAATKTGGQWIKFSPCKFEYTGISGNLDYVDIPQNQWIHHAVVKFGNAFTYYRNGVAYTNGTTTSGTFVPNTNETVAVIDGAGHTYDFDPQNSASINLPWRNGLNMDVDPSTNILANFNGDPTNHSLLSAHASKGITFDLAAVCTVTGLSIERFTATIGDSRPKVLGTISYFVFVDGVLVTNRFAVHDSEDFVTVKQVSKGRYLTIAITDANDGTVCDHGYLGDAFLTLVPYVPPEPNKGTCIMVH